MKPSRLSSLGRRFPAGVLAAALLAAPKPALAGGPLYLCDSGVAFVWPSAGANIPFNPDQGGLGPLNSAAAVALVASAFGVWEAVPTATVSYVNAGALPVDVDVTNFMPFLTPAAPDGLSAVVFDDTGEIFELLFGPESGVLGFAGPEWTDAGTCTVLEGVCFLNGPAFEDAIAALDVMVHEFGHYTGLAHTVVNGQIGIGDTSGPTPDNLAFGRPGFGTDVLETMYPFYFGPGIGSNTLEADDVSVLSTLYPAPGFVETSGSISGTIFAPNGITRLSGVNVIARNLANPFEDAVSAISGDFSSLAGDAYAGLYTLNGLTSGAEYAVFVDQILAGEFSTAPVTLPGPEEFFNGPDEGAASGTDHPSELVAVSPSAGFTTTGVDVIFNAPTPGEPLPLSDDGSLEIFLPFPFTICEQTFLSVFVNANGNVTFGSPDGGFHPTAADLLGGPPRIAALWQDFNPERGGVITFDQTADTLSIHWRNVPEFRDPGSSATMSITLHRSGNRVDVQYGAVGSLSGLAGLSCGSCGTSGLETPADLSPSTVRGSRLGLWRQPAVFEVFDRGSAFDLAGRTVRYQANMSYSDLWAGSNNTFATARAITVPFNSSATALYTEIEPVAADVDFYRFHLNAGDHVIAELVRGCFDSVLGLFLPTGELVAVDNDGGAGLLSRLSHTTAVSGAHALAVSAFADLGFTGGGGGGGRYVLDVRRRNCPPPGPPGPANWLVNGSFDSGDFTGWVAGDTGLPISNWAVLDDAGLGFFRPVQPQDGCHLAVNGFEGGGPMQSFLYQDVAVPGSLASLTLEWKDRVEWDLLNFGPATADRAYRVEIVDPVTGSVLETVESLTLGVGTVRDTGWVRHRFDASAYIGRNIRLRFIQDIPELYSGPAQFELDDVRLSSQ